MVKIAISGVLGRMGKTIAKLAYEDSNVNIVAGIENPDCAHSHDTVGEILGVELNAPITTDLAEVIENIDVVIEFSNSTEAAISHLRLLAADKSKKGMVIGTTGFSKEELKEIKELAKDIPVVLAPNMSIGVNLLFKLVQEAARALKDKGYDIEVIEMHHRFKKDAPSGTAVRIVDILKAETGIKNVIYGRQGDYPEGRPSDEIAVFALRGGDVVGDHTVIFAGLGERIELTHKAGSRDIFAKGAVEAAKWIKDKKPALYDMMDVLNLK
ncbi:MAG: 4-hydroxy-tetrahydrodipicolinate reductase [Aquificota bacterium]|nr:MAG: 4-hydroxy-tetrahydrodipicolinate reductase [Aquificota bacterium]